MPLLAITAVAVLAAACSGGNGGTAPPTPSSLPPALAIPTPRATPSSTPRPASDATQRPAPGAADNAEPSADPDAPSGLIALVSPDLDVYTVRGDGTRRVQVSPPKDRPGRDTANGNYVWPLWAPDGASLLFSRILPPDQFGARVALVSAAADGSDDLPVVVYEDDPATGGIGGTAPHYTEYSPDGTGLAAIVGTAQGLVLTVFDATRPGSRGVDLVTGAPLYFDWSNDSRSLIVHQNDRLLTYNDVLAGEAPDDERGAPATFFAPAASPVADRTVVVQDGSSGRELRLLDGGDIFLADVPAGAEFAWSPDGRRIAMLRQTSGGIQPGVFDELSVIDVNPAGRATKRVLQSGRPMRSLWWAPDSTRLALGSADRDDPRKLTWEVVDVVGGDLVKVGTVLPTPEFDFAQVFSGQYERSHNIWSPDSRYLVLTGAFEQPLATDGAIGSGGPEVWVIDAAGKKPARSLGPGVLAFWSPR